jgi:hypothetical protein
MTRKIFISSSSGDSDLARDLAKRLDQPGLKVVTPAEGADGGNTIKARISEALRTADEIVFILTKNSVDSQRLLFEMGAATSLEKHVTVLIQGVEHEELPDIIKQMDYVKYADLEQFIAKLQQQPVAVPSKSAA